MFNMRRITRLPLEKRILSYLARQQAKVDAGNDVHKRWKNSRKTGSLKKVAALLRQMAGKRERCMYCQDSRATQIDHFWPLGLYPARAFSWENMLHACDGCNNRKQHRFDLDAHGQPLLIDPTTIDPWDHLYFEPATGMLTARYVAGVESPIGRYTTDPGVLPLNIEAITSGRQRTARNLIAAVSDFLANTAPMTGDSESKLIQAILDRDDFGLSEWFFFHDGTATKPFSTLKLGFPQVWARIQAAVH
jgi:uncharacterized protein (TIGR02646 family)